jgi:hypothetical protein
MAGVGVGAAAASHYQGLHTDQWYQYHLLLWHKIPHNELWYTQLHETYHSGSRLEVIRKSLGGSFDYAGSNSSEGELCCIGIEHLLTRESMLHVRDCRVRCTYAVLAEQARQGSNELSVALASFGQTRVTARRAMALAKLHKGADEKA